MYLLLSKYIYLISNYCQLQFMLLIIFLLYICYHFVHKIQQFFFLRTKPHNIFNYFQRTLYIIRYKGKILHASLKN